MGAMSDYLESALLNAVFRGVAYNSPSEVYVALYTSDPTDADGGTEVAGGAYARQVAQFDAPVTSGSTKVIRNTTDIAFPIATAGWGTVTHIGVRDAEAGGNLLYHGKLVTAKAIETNDQFKLLAGNLELTLD